MVHESQASSSPEPHARSGKTACSHSSSKLSITPTFPLKRDLCWAASTHTKTTSISFPFLHTPHTTVQVQHPTCLRQEQRERGRKNAQNQAVQAWLFGTSTRSVQIHISDFQSEKISPFQETWKQYSTVTSETDRQTDLLAVKGKGQGNRLAS